MGASSSFCPLYSSKPWGTVLSSLPGCLLPRPKGHWPLLLPSSNPSPHPGPSPHCLTCTPVGLGQEHGKARHGANLGRGACGAGTACCSFHPLPSPVLEGQTSVVPSSGLSPPAQPCTSEDSRRASELTSSPSPHRPLHPHPSTKPPGGAGQEQEHSEILLTRARGRRGQELTWGLSRGEGLLHAPIELLCATEVGWDGGTGVQWRQLLHLFVDMDGVSLVSTLPAQGHLVTDVQGLFR